MGAFTLLDRQSLPCNCSQARVFLSYKLDIPKANILECAIYSASCFQMRSGNIYICKKKIGYNTYTPHHAAAIDGRSGRKAEGWSVVDLVLECHALGPVCVSSCHAHTTRTWHTHTAHTHTLGYSSVLHW